MDIDTPLGEMLLEGDLHNHLIWIPGFGKSFPLPFRVLTLIGLGIFCWASNLHILRWLGIDVYSVLRARRGGQVDEGDRSQRGTASFIANERTNYRTLHLSVYRMFVVYASLVLMTWCFFRLATKGEEEGINRYRVIPSILVAVVILCLFSPYTYEKPTREALLRGLHRCLIPSSGRPTEFSDIVLADIFTSFAKVFGDLWISAYMTFYVGHITSIPTQEGFLQWIVPTMMSVPYFVRLRQCCIDYVASDRRSKRSLWNALKYATAFPVIFLSSAQSIVVTDLIAEKGEARVLGTLWHGEHALFRLWLLFVFINSIFSFWWDVTNDWGLTILDRSLWTRYLWPEKASYHVVPDNLITAGPLQSSSDPDGLMLSHTRSYSNRTPDLVTAASLPATLPSPVTSLPGPSRTSGIYVHTNASAGKMPRAFGLRPRLLFRVHLVYYCIISINLILRLTWSLKLSSHLHNVAEFGSGVFIMEALEIIRRWLWVFLRIEWEVVKKYEQDEQDEDEGILQEHQEDYELQPGRRGIDETEQKELPL